MPESIITFFHVRHGGKEPLPDHGEIPAVSITAYFGHNFTHGMLPLKHMPSIHFCRSVRVATLHIALRTSFWKYGYFMAQLSDIRQKPM
jgi:hypothetical protein